MGGPGGAALPPPVLRGGGGGGGAGQGSGPCGMGPTLAGIADPVALWRWDLAPDPGPLCGPARAPRSPAAEARRDRSPALVAVARRLRVCPCWCCWWCALALASAAGSDALWAWCAQWWWAWWWRLCCAPGKDTRAAAAASAPAPDSRAQGSSCGMRPWAKLDLRLLVWLLGQPVLGAAAELGSVHMLLTLGAAPMGATASAAVAEGARWARVSAARGAVAAAPAVRAAASSLPARLP